jgi:hypothetical protein
VLVTVALGVVDLVGADVLLGLSGIPVTDMDQDIGDVQDGCGQVVPGSGPAQMSDGGSPSAARTARSASPSVAAGAPHTAITASPMNFSTTPPYRLTTVRATAKYSDSSSRTASGSRDSDSGVKAHDVAEQHRAHPPLGHRLQVRRRPGIGDPAAGPDVWLRGTAGPAETIAGSNRITARRATAGGSTAPPAEPVAVAQRRAALPAPHLAPPYATLFNRAGPAPS